MRSIKTKDSKPETVLFNRIYSIYYKTAITMLEEIRTGKLKTLDDLNAYLNQFPFFRKTGNKRINTRQDEFTDSVEGLYKLKQNCITTPITHKIDFPLSNLEISFLKTAVTDPRFQLFLNDDIFNNLKKELQKDQFKNIEPLSTSENYLLFDQYKNGDKALYTNEKYKEIFRLILDAAGSGKKLKFAYIEDNTQKIKIAIPEKIEYSQKDDRFRVVIPCKNRPLNIQNITECSYTDEEASKIKDRKLLQLKLSISDTTPEQYHKNLILREFSYFEKTCRQIDNTTYELTATFDKSDINEMVIRILKFGPCVKATEPQELVMLIKEKLTRQMKLIHAADEKNKV